jgi:deoxyadenosine/deoxycytidine kinase
MRIHIAGPSGAGKTTIGNKLKDKFKNKIVVKDIDDLRSDFIKEFYGDKKWTIIDKKAYQKYIDDYVGKIKKPLILVGLNNMQ